MGQISEPIEAVQGTNDFGRVGYNGPCPPPGTPHCYHLRVYGLDSKLDLSAGSARIDLEDAMEGHIVQKGETEAAYGR